MGQFDLLSSIAQGSMDNLLFYALAIVAIPCAFGVIFDRVIIRSGFFLIGVFGSISGLFLLLQAQFLALAQLMIYAVGITLVVVIALMLTNPRQTMGSSPVVGRQKLSGLLVAAFFFLLIYLALRSESWPISSLRMVTDNVRLIGVNLMVIYVLPFEFASVLLLAALIGAILIAKADPQDNERGKNTEVG